MIGLSIAWRASAHGSVAVVDDRPGEGASAAAGGMLAPVTEVHYGEEGLLRLGLASAEMYPEFVAELEEASGRRVGYERSGALLVARDADDNAALEDLYRFQRELGLDVERLSGGECRRLEPALAPRTRGGVLVHGDHRLDNRALVAALLAACERAGVVLHRRRAASVRIEGGRLTGVDLEGGEALSCGTAVLAAGCWSGGVGGIPPEARPPVRPVKGQILTLRGPAEPRLLTRIVRGLDVYLVPREDGRVVVGATAEEMGFDTTVTAGAVHTLLRDAYELVPGITELELVETTAGLRPGSPDNAPILGETPVEGLLVATGHFRGGILLAPVTARAIVDLVRTGRVPAIIRPFSPRRFLERTEARA